MRVREDQKVKQYTLEKLRESIKFQMPE